MWKLGRDPATCRRRRSGPEEHATRLDNFSERHSNGLLNGLRQVGAGHRSLKQLCIAMHNYHDVHDAFPPQSLVNKKGERLLSWRVRLLPDLGQFNLYQQFRQDEAWDSEHNRQLIHQMPEIFRSSSLGQVTEAKTCLVLAQTENSFGGRHTQSDAEHQRRRLDWEPSMMN